MSEDTSCLAPLRSIYKGACEALTMPTAGPEIIHYSSFIIHYSLNLQIPSPFNRSHKRYSVGVLQVASYGETVGEAAYLNT